MQASDLLTKSDNTWRNPK